MDEELELLQLRAAAKAKAEQENAVQEEDVFSVDHSKNSKKDAVDQAKDMADIGARAFFRNLAPFGGSYESKLMAMSGGAKDEKDAEKQFQDLSKEYPKTKMLSSSAGFLASLFGPKEVELLGKFAKGVSSSSKLAKLANLSDLSRKARVAINAIESGISGFAMNPNEQGEEDKGFNLEDRAKNAGISALIGGGLTGGLEGFQHLMGGKTAAYKKAFDALDLSNEKLKDIPEKKRLEIGKYIVDNNLMSVTSKVRLDKTKKLSSEGANELNKIINSAQSSADDLLIDGMYQKGVIDKNKLYSEMEGTLAKEGGYTPDLPGFSSKKKAFEKAKTEATQGVGEVLDPEGNILEYAQPSNADFTIKEANDQLGLLNQMYQKVPKSKPFQKEMIEAQRKNLRQMLSDKIAEIAGEDQRAAYEAANKKIHLANKVDELSKEKAGGFVNSLKRHPFAAAAILGAGAGAYYSGNPYYGATIGGLALAEPAVLSKILSKNISKKVPLLTRQGQRLLPMFNKKENINIDSGSAWEDQ